MYAYFPLLPFCITDRENDNFISFHPCNPSVCVICVYLCFILFANYKRKNEEPRCLRPSQERFVFLILAR